MARTTTRAKTVCAIAASTCPVSGADRAIGIVRNRSMIPSVASFAIRIAVLCATDTTVITRIAGVR